MDPITSAIVLGAASSLAGSLVTHLFGWLTSRTKDAHVQAVGVIVANAAAAGAQAAAQAAASGDIKGAGKAAGAAAIAVAVPAILGPPSPTPADDHA